MLKYVHRPLSVYVMNLSCHVVFNPSLKIFGYSMLYAYRHKLHFRHIVNKFRHKYLSWTLLYLSLICYS